MRRAALAFAFGVAITLAMTALTSDGYFAGLSDHESEAGNFAPVIAHIHRTPSNAPESTSRTLLGASLLGVGFIALLGAGLVELGVIRRHSLA